MFIIPAAVLVTGALVCAAWVTQSLDDRWLLLFSVGIVLVAIVIDIYLRWRRRVTRILLPPTPVGYSLERELRR